MDPAPLTLARLREKWAEVPAGLERIFSADLLALPDADLLAWWEERWHAHGSPRNGAWYYEVYAESFVAKRVLEIGSGLGFDAIFFAGRGARWTCCDIVAENLGVIRRVADLKGLGDRIATHYIDDSLSFDGVGEEYDIVWANGSLINLPFDMARRECADILPRLKPGGRWIELAYPPERWRRDGSPPFAAWGRMTDGPRTPWMEWYDLGKLRHRLSPARFVPLLAFNYAYDAFNWFDLLLDQSHPVTRAELDRPVTTAILDLAVDTGTTAFTGAAAHRVADGVAIETPTAIWAFAYALDVGPLLPTTLVGSQTPVVVECVIEVAAGTFGIALATPDLGAFVCREAFVDAGRGVANVWLEAPASEVSRLVLRNAAQAQSRGRLLEVRLSWP